MSKNEFQLLCDLMIELLDANKTEKLKELLVKHSSNESSKSTEK
jgi:hypothetical protein